MTFAAALRELHILSRVALAGAGYVALYAAKGAWLHRRSGMVFSYAMLLMTGIATVMALTTHPNRSTSSPARSPSTWSRPDCSR
jgi:uncharacterized membrane protein